MRRISEIDGSIRALLAYLDDDEDGLIRKKQFFNLLRREDVFLTLKEDQVESLLKAFYTKDGEFLQLIPLLRFCEGEKLSLGSNQKEQLMITQAELEEMDAKLIADQEYTFSTDPEIKAVERKLRSFGQVLAKKGVDCEKEFAVYDNKRNGSILRTDFIKVLSKLGIYLLEEGKVLKENHGGNNGVNRMEEDEIRQLQLKQIYQLKHPDSVFGKCPPLPSPLLSYISSSSPR
jgi:Ca2+-binding EF-hand superfamily protein